MFLLGACSLIVFGWGLSNIISECLNGPKMMENAEKLPRSRTPISSSSEEEDDDISFPPSTLIEIKQNYKS